MKCNILFAMMLISGGLYACSSDDIRDANTIGEITADITDISVPSDGGTYIINLGVKGKGNTWKSIVPSDPWMTMTPTGGYHKSGHYRLSVEVSPNSGKDNRQGEICIYTTSSHLKINVQQSATTRDGCCGLSDKEVFFSATECRYHDITVSPYEDIDMTTSDAEWLQIAGVPEGGMTASKEFTISITPDGPYPTGRSALISFVGKESGQTSIIEVKHAGHDCQPAFPSRWYYTNSEAASCGWLISGAAEANYDTGSQRSFVSAVGVNNLKLNRSISTAYKNSIAVSGLYTGDYLLFSIPSGKLEAGTSVDFMLTISSANNSAPKYWICEIYDGGQWRCPDQSTLSTNDDGVKYSFYTKHFSSYQHTSFTQSFTLDKTLIDGMVRVRCRVVGERNGLDAKLSPTNSGEIYLPSHEFHFCTATAYPGIARKDIKKVAILGNSFTHYFASAFLLKEIARSQGHQLDIRINAKGSQYLSNHMELELSRDITDRSGYDYIILQEQSTRYSDYANNPQETTLSDCKALTARFRNGSPTSKIILENTWAFPKSNWNNFGSSSEFEKHLLNGTLAIAKADNNVDWVSPIGVAFDKAVAAGMSDLFYTDSKHPNRNGAYLKSCVNYLVIFGEKFDKNVSDGGCDPTVAARLRAFAEETVLGHESDYMITR